MPPGIFSRIVLIIFWGFAAPAHAWEERVIERVELAVNNARCISPLSPNDTVHILNVPTDQSIMSKSEARTAVLDLTDAFAPHYRFKVTRGGALPYEADTQPATQQGAREMAELLEVLSNAAVTVFFYPYERLPDHVRTEITLLIRSVENGRDVLKCTPSFRVDIPVASRTPDRPDQTQDCTELPQELASNLKLAEVFVGNYYEDLSARRVECVKDKWLPTAAPRDIGDMVEATASARLNRSVLDRERSTSDQAIVIADADVTTMDGKTEKWKVEVHIVPTPTGLKIVKLRGLE